jgi:eukaryotic-like serine/threonine-protein kinase
MAAEPDAAAGPAELERAVRIHRLCEEFERLWRCGGQPSIERFLEQTDPADQATLFDELLILELELRGESGDPPAASDYVARFPSQAGRVAAAFCAAAPLRRRTGPAGHDPDATHMLGQAPAQAAAGAGNHAVSSAAGCTLKTVGDYEILGEIARGGMGVVFKATQRSLKRLVALKMILAGQMASPQQRARFLREAQLAASLDHANIVPIIEVSEFQGCPFFSMKLVDGESLDHQIEARSRSDTRIDPKAAAGLVASVARAVHYAHDRGFLHCDLKPSNILVDREGRPHVTDFGLAKHAGDDSSQTASGTILGTPSYMAPEQAAGMRKSLRPTTDVYGLGAILYELLTGCPPFRADTVMETVVAVLERDPAPPRELNPDVPRELETICLKCLEKSPQTRYPSAAALADELERYVRGEVIDATALLPRLRRWNRREPELVARLGGLLLVAVFTQFNYQFLSPNPVFRLHYTVQAVLGLWAVSAVLFQFLLRSGRHADLIRVFWSAGDIIFLTIELKLLDRLESTLLVGYPLLIAASALWCRVRLVWLTTALAILAYLILYLDTAVAWHAGRLAWRPRTDLQYPNIYMAGLLIAGYVAARQVRRILALSQFYENRPGV